MGIYVLHLTSHTCMTGAKSRDKIKERKQDIARINQLYVQQSLEDGNCLSLIVQYI